MVFGPHLKNPARPGLFLSDLKLPMPVLKVAAGEHHTLLLTATGLYAMGSNREGQLGVAGVQEAAEPVAVPAAGALTAIACGARHSAGLDSQGRLLAWGWSLHGEPWPTGLPAAG
jgi:alpha-tubulin suppressor-like RCC1 family protein